MYKKLKMLIVCPCLWKLLFPKVAILKLNINIHTRTNFYLDSLPSQDPQQIAKLSPCALFTEWNYISTKFKYKKNYCECKIRYKIISIIF